MENARVDPDVALMLRVRDDDAMAFEMLIERYQRKIIRFMSGWTRSPEQAEDLAQDVFLRVYRSRKSYVPTAKFSTWVYRIAHNIASNHVRDSAVRREYQTTKAENSSTAGMLIENIAVAPSGFQPVRKLDQEERAQMILHALQALGERQRMAILLSKFEGMSYQEIGDTMGLTVQATKSLLSRARVNLKNLLEPYVNEGNLAANPNARQQLEDDDEEADSESASQRASSANSANNSIDASIDTEDDK